MKSLVPYSLGIKMINAVASGLRRIGTALQKEVIMIKGIISTFFKAIGVPIGSIIAAVQAILLAIQYILEFIYNISDVIIINIDKFLLNILPTFPPFGSIRSWGEGQLIKILEKREVKIKELKKKIKS